MFLIFVTNSSTANPMIDSARSQALEVFSRWSPEQPSPSIAIVHLLDQLYGPRSFQYHPLARHNGEVSSGAPTLAQGYRMNIKNIYSVQLPENTCLLIMVDSFLTSPSTVPVEGSLR